MNSYEGKKVEETFEDGHLFCVIVYRRNIFGRTTAFEISIMDLISAGIIFEPHFRIRLYYLTRIVPPCKIDQQHQ